MHVTMHFWGTVYSFQVFSNCLADLNKFFSTCSFSSMNISFECLGLAITFKIFPRLSTSVSGFFLCELLSRDLVVMFLASGSCIFFHGCLVNHHTTLTKMTKNISQNQCTNLSQKCLMFFLTSVLKLLDATNIADVSFVKIIIYHF